MSEDPFPFGDQPSPWTDEGGELPARQTALGCRRVLRSGRRGPMIVMVLAVLVLPLVGLAVQWLLAEFLSLAMP